MTTTNIHSLQGFYIYYRMYVVVRRLGILLLFFSLLKMEIMKGYLKEIFQPLSFLFFRAYFGLNKERNFSIKETRVDDFLI